MVAIARQFASVKALEIFFIAIYALHQLEALHTWVTHLAILHGVVVSNHIEVEEIFNLLEGRHRMLGIPLRATEIGILA